jgi:hypothetical protein
VWDSASDVADFFVERAHAVVEAHGPPTRKPERMGETVSAYVRSDDLTSG